MPEEFKKITLDTAPAAAPAATDPKPMKQKKPFPWKFVYIPVGIIILVIVLIALMLLPMRGVIAKAQDTMKVGRELGDAIKTQDLAASKEKLAATRTSLTALQGEYNKILALRLVPFLGAYISDGDHAIKAGFAGLDAGDSDDSSHSGGGELSPQLRRQ